MRQVLKVPGHILILFFLLFWGTSLVCTFLAHHTTQNNYAHAHFAISMPTGDRLFTAQNRTAHSDDSAVSHELASPDLVTFHSGHTGATDSVSAQPLIIPESIPLSASLWEFPITQPIWHPSETFLLPPDRPPAFPALA